MKRFVAVCLALLLGMLSISSVAVAEEEKKEYYQAWAGMRWAWTLSTDAAVKEAEKLGWKRETKMMWHFGEEIAELSMEEVTEDKIEELYQQGYNLRAVYLWKPMKKIKYSHSMENIYVGCYIYSMESAKAYYRGEVGIIPMPVIEIDGERILKPQAEDWERLKAANWERGYYYHWVKLDQKDYINNKDGIGYMSIEVVEEPEKEIPQKDIHFFMKAFMQCKNAGNEVRLITTVAVRIPSKIYYECCVKELLKNVKEYLKTKYAEMLINKGVEKIYLEVDSQSMYLPLPYYPYEK